MSDKDSVTLYTLKPVHLFVGAIALGSLLIFVTSFSLQLNILCMFSIMSIYTYLIATNINNDISREQKADSIYYLGFILTIIAMLNTLLSLDVANITDVFDEVVKDFGLALVTTVIGLSIRIIWLQLQSENIADGEETIREKLLNEAQELQTQTQRITGAFSTLAADAERISQPISGNLKNLSKTLEIPSELSTTLGKIAFNSDKLNMSLIELDSQVKSIDLKSFEELSKKIEILNLILDRLSPILEVNLNSLNETFEISSKQIQNYNNSLKSLLEETKVTYSEVNHSLRKNAQVIKDELK